MIKKTLKALALGKAENCIRPWVWPEKTTKPWIWLKTDPLRSDH